MRVLSERNHHSGFLRSGPIHSGQQEKSLPKKPDGRETRNSRFTGMMSLELSEKDIKICINEQYVQDKTTPQENWNIQATVK